MPIFHKQKGISYLLDKDELKTGLNLENWSRESKQANKQALKKVPKD